jgi:hypothetical protein
MDIPHLGDTEPEATQLSWSSLTTLEAITVVTLTIVVGSSGSEALPRSCYRRLRSAWWG